MFVSLGSLETYNVALIPTPTPMLLACSVQVTWGGPGWVQTPLWYHQDAPGTERAVSALMLVSYALSNLFIAIFPYKAVRC